MFRESFQAQARRLAPAAQVAFRRTTAAMNLPQGRKKPGGFARGNDPTLLHENRISALLEVPPNFISRAEKFWRARVTVHRL